MYVSVNKIQQARYLRKKFLEWQEQKGGFPTAKEFSEFLGVNEKTLSAWMNAKISPSREKAVKICEIIGEYDLLDILGYARPSTDTIPVSSLPSDLRERLREALLEIDRTLKTRSIQPDTPEGLEISISVMKKFGFSFISTEIEQTTS